MELDIVLYNKVISNINKYPCNNLGNKVEYIEYLFIIAESNLYSDKKYLYYDNDKLVYNKHKNSFSIPWIFVKDFVGIIEFYLHPKQDIWYWRTNGSYCKYSSYCINFDILDEMLKLLQVKYYVEKTGDYINYYLDTCKEDKSNPFWYPYYDSTLYNIMKHDTSYLEFKKQDEKVLNFKIGYVNQYETQVEYYLVHSKLVHDSEIGLLKTMSLNPTMIEDQELVFKTFPKILVKLLIKFIYFGINGVKSTLLTKPEKYGLEHHTNRSSNTVINKFITNNIRGNSENNVHQMLSFADFVDCELFFNSIVECINLHRYTYLLYPYRYILVNNKWFQYYCDKHLKIRNEYIDILDRANKFIDTIKYEVSSVKFMSMSQTYFFSIKHENLNLIISVDFKLKSISIVKKKEVIIQQEINIVGDICDKYKYKYEVRFMTDDPNNNCKYTSIENLFN